MELHYRGDSAEIATKLNVELWDPVVVVMVVVVVARSQVSGTARAQKLKADEERAV
jgi:hypothetical protein